MGGSTTLPHIQAQLLPGSVYSVYILHENMCPSAAQGRAGNCCTWLPGDKPGSASLQVVSPMCLWLMHQRQTCGLVSLVAGE